MTRFDLTFIIDDDRIFAFVLQKLLDKTGRFDQMINLSNGSDAIEALMARYRDNMPLPDLIFLDLNMPVLDGWQFLDEIEKLPFSKHLRIHIISSSIDAREMARAQQYAAVKSFVSKPVSLDWLLQID